VKAGFAPSISVPQESQKVMRIVGSFVRASSHRPLHLRAGSVVIAAE
jgi:hypothetical protein